MALKTLLTRELCRQFQLSISEAMDIVAGEFCDLKTVSDVIKAAQDLGLVTTKLEKLTKYKKYKFIKILGSGKYSVVCLAQDENGNKVAIKRILGRKFSRKSVPKALHQSETNIMRKLKGVNDIVEIYDSFKVYDGTFKDEWWIVMEYIPWPTLYTMLKSSEKSLNDKLNIMANIGAALSKVHEYDIVHKDLKPANIHINPETLKVKLIDFGFSHYADDTKRSIIIGGTPTYMKPFEHYSSDKYTDIFALGRIKYNILLWERSIVGTLLLKSLGITMPQRPTTQHLIKYISDYIIPKLDIMIKEKYPDLDL